ncbi:hypothetical protein [Pedobacter sp. JY14-1]|uniref:hypothetical protein n=1 Tax=Pedobacter sp. JY14-1 TaxID=3034151 RepID=UPI0023E1C808|nr:hypothetical protein [Pedobacter sp. JY14-1]
MKVKTINYRLILKMAPVLILLMGLVCWQLAFKKTWAAYGLYRQLTAAAAPSAELGISPGYTARRTQAMEQLYNRFEIDSAFWKGQLWNACATLGPVQGLQVKAFPGWERDSLAGRPVLRQHIELSGAYFKLLAMQRQLDTAARIGRITTLIYRRAPRDLQTTMELIFTGIPVIKSNKESRYEEQ